MHEKCLRHQYRSHRHSTTVRGTTHRLAGSNNVSGQAQRLAVKARADGQRLQRQSTGGDSANFLEQSAYMERQQRQNEQWLGQQQWFGQSTETGAQWQLGCNVHSPFKRPTAARFARSGLAAHYNIRAWTASRHWATGSTTMRQRWRPSSRSRVWLVAS